MKHAMLLGAALMSTLVTGCYNYVPPKSLAQVGSYEPPSGLDDPDEIAVVDKTHGAPKSFTFIDGRGHELNVDELLDRYRRVVGDDRAADTLGQNHFHLSLGMIALSAGFVALETLGIMECAHSTCTGKETGDLVLGGAFTAAIVGATGYEMLVDDRSLAPLTRGQAEELATRYNAAVRRHAPAPALDPATPTSARQANARTGPAIRADGLSIPF
jgi:hypothetical protein